ncbi:unnamed protein product [Pseudo-nitzschia multistriata]|uniref:Plastid lipid-associated protein/fibrillin conserved domain-containing protein n=1 Tax=Pseudo-nitzschia multistriata TaxID=183589 RepID=A0A448YZF2_9STRA|nr:unnamed protein product [Pseudo-nitzschia multistriata]
MVVLSSLRVAVAASCLSAAAHGFSVVPNAGRAGNAIVAGGATQLHGRARGGLGSIDADETSGPSKKTRTGLKKSTKLQRKQKKKGGKKSGSAPSSAMSPDLEKFLQQSGSDGVVEAEVVGKTKSARGGRDRRQKQSEQRAIDKERSAKVGTVLEKLEEVLEERTGKVGDILAVVRELLEIPSNDNGDLRRLLSGKDRSDYRLAWVGSDDALCHVGTGLHKVPLARMKEVFMNCLGKNKIEILEVISILGPFPNVKNVLQGTAKPSSGSAGSEMQIVYDTMYDGTGKEIMAGTDDNIRRVDLEVAFCDERAIVVVMPDENANAKPLDGDGRRVLLFVREDDLDDKLEGLRVNELD